MADFAPATVYAYSTWPKGTDNYWALPAMGDANGWFYRKDWFAKPELQAEFKAKYNRDLAPPKTWTELKEVAEFFQGRDVDGKKVYGAAIFTERALGRHHHGRNFGALLLRLQIRKEPRPLRHGRCRQLRRRDQGPRSL